MEEKEISIEVLMNDRMGNEFLADAHFSIKELNSVLNAHGFRIIRK